MNKATNLLTEAEVDVLVYLVAAWDSFMKLPQIHPDHKNEFRASLHNLQRIVLSRPASVSLNLTEEAIDEKAN